MDIKSVNIDDVFNGANTTLGTMYAAANVLYDGWNNIKNSMSSSRRNMNGGYGYGYGYGGSNYGYGYGQPASYGYGYADYGYPQQGGYPYGNSMYPYPNNGGFSNPGYFGFTDPSYGLNPGMNQQNGPVLDMMPNMNCPQGGAWGL